MIDAEAFSGEEKFAGDPSGVTSVSSNPIRKS